MEKSEEFFEILKQLNINANYLKKNRTFEPDESLLNRLDAIECELMTMIIKYKQYPIT